MYEYDDYYYLNYEQNELDKVFIIYCAYGNIDRVKHMLTAKEMKNRPNIHANNDEAFNLLVSIQNLEIRPHLEVIEYLIFEQKMDRTVAIDEILNSNEYEHMQRIKNMFILMEAQSLNDELSNNKIKVSKAKI